MLIKKKSNLNFLRIIQNLLIQSFLIHICSTVEYSVSSVLLQPIVLNHLSGGSFEQSEHIE